MSECIVHRNDEDAEDGVQFDDLREAMDHIKSRAASEGKTVRDYTMLPIYEQL